MSKIHRQIERSSLGTSAAKAARRTVSSAAADRLVQRANAMRTTTATTATTPSKPLRPKKSGG